MCSLSVPLSFTLKIILRENFFADTTRTAAAALGYLICACYFLFCLFLCFCSISKEELHAAIGSCGFNPEELNEYFARSESFSFEFMFCFLKYFSLDANSDGSISFDGFHFFVDHY